MMIRDIEHRQTFEIAMQKAESVDAKVRVLRGELNYLLRESRVVRSSYDQAKFSNMSEEEFLLFAVVNMAWHMADMDRSYSDFINTHAMPPRVVMKKETI